MWTSFVATLCIAGAVLAYNEPQSVSVHTSVGNRTINNNANKIIRRSSCPDGFIRSGKNCFYFSAGTANWQDAHFFCKDRNSTIATLPTRKNNKQLKELLGSPQFKQLERWIGARYNWRDKTWEWGVTGEKITYHRFRKLSSANDQIQQWHCVAMNPKRQYRWAVRNCMENKHYVCQAPAVRLGKARRNLPGVGRRVRTRKGKNQTSNLNLDDENRLLPYTRSPWRITRKSLPMWGNGMELGMQPPTRTRWAPGAKYSDRLHLVKGKGPTEPDQWVPKPKVKKLSDNKLETPSEGASKNGPSARGGPMTLATDGDSTLDQLGLLSNMFDGEVLLKT